MQKILPRPTGTHEMNASFRGWLGNLYEYLYSGVYTPTLTNTLNVASSAAFKCRYLRVGAVVTVSGRVTIDPTAAAPTVTQLGISLPIPSNIGAIEDCSGTANCENVNQTGIIEGVPASDRAQITALVTDAANRAWHFVFNYEVM